MSDNNHSENASENKNGLGFSTDYAVALGYEKDKHNAPTVLAKGQGEVAERIVQLALDNDIEIRQDADLVQILKTVDINEEISLEALAAVAEIISYVYRQNVKEL